MSRQQEVVMQRFKPMSASEAQKFLVKLANTDLGALDHPDDPGAPITFFHELARYLVITEEKQLAGQIRKAQNKPDLLDAAIKDIRELLDAIIAVSKDGDRRRLRAATFKIGWQTLGFTIDEENVISMRDADELRTALIDTAVEDFDQTKWRLLRIGRCQRCSKYLYKVKLNQEYCGYDCANKAAAQRRIGRLKGAAKGGKMQKEVRSNATQT
jgi:hypothetical protein